jgi:5-methylcytosine-specific restriction protein A
MITPSTRARLNSRVIGSRWTARDAHHRDDLGECADVGRRGLVDPVYTLIRESPEAPTAAVNALVEKYFETTDATELLAELGLSEPVKTSPAVASFSERVAAYKRLCMRVDRFWRDRDARAARTSALHIHDLVLGGRDDPSQMIALCPNCHAIKTRVSTRHGLKKVLLERGQAAAR